MKFHRHYFLSNNKNQDQSFAKMKYKDWTSALSPKVAGTWNIYEAIKGNMKDIDFFVAFGSMVGLCGNFGQANYAAANSFLDAFSKYARSEGCPACVIHLGAVGDIGYFSDNIDVQRIWLNNNVRLIRERTLVQAVQTAIYRARSFRDVQDRSQMSTVMIGFDQLLGLGTHSSLYERDPRFGPYNILKSQPEQKISSKTNQIQKFISDVEADPSILEQQETEDLLVVEMASLINSETNPQDDSQEAGEIQIDSLMTIEIRNWLRKSLSVDIPTIQIAKAKNVRGLALLTIELLKKKYMPKE